MSAAGTTSRPDPTKCRSGLHDWVEENLYVDPLLGKTTCRLCKAEARKSFDRGESHPKNAEHCRKGHPYTLENTRKKVRMVNGQKTIARQCIQCEKDAFKTTAQRG